MNGSHVIFHRVQTREAFEAQATVNQLIATTMFFKKLKINIKNSLESMFFEGIFMQMPSMEAFIQLVSTVADVTQAGFVLCLHQHSSMFTVFEGIRSFIERLFFDRGGASCCFMLNAVPVSGQASGFCHRFFKEFFSLSTFASKFYCSRKVLCAGRADKTRLSVAVEFLNPKILFKLANVLFKNLPINTPDTTNQKYFLRHSVEHGN